MPTSGSARRRARERLAAEATRAACERLARAKRQQLLRDKTEHQRQAREELASYEPWGRPGGGAPNADSIRYRNLRLRNLYPEDELKGLSNVNNTTWQWPGGRKKAPLRLHEDTQLRYQFAEDMRRAVDNDIRYRVPPDQQQSYKETLDDLVETKKKIIKDETKKDVEFERKMHSMKGPWGRPGPGGNIWRNPRNVGSNFHNSMGWTDNAAFKKIKSDHRRVKRSSLTLPEIEKSHNLTQTKEKERTSKVEKLPDINIRNQSDSESKPNALSDNETNKENVSYLENENASPNVDRDRKEQQTKKKNKFVKRLSNGKRVKTTVVAEDIIDNSNDNSIKTTPESTILRMTGGVELVPLLARRRRVGARTLPSSDVTRQPHDPCQWRDMLHEEYLRELKNQIRVKCQQKEDGRRDSAENCRRHHATWAALWGRPGHGAPQPGRLYRNNLLDLLYLAPLAPPAI